MKAGCGEVKQSVLVFSPQIFSPCQIDVSKRQRVSHQGPHDPVHQPHREPDAERRWRRRRKGGWRMEDQSKWSSFSLKVREGKRKVVGLNPQGGNHSRRSKWVLKGAVRNVRTWVPLDDLWGKTDKHKSEVWFLRPNLSCCDVMGDFAGRDVRRVDPRKTDMIRYCLFV